MKVLVVDDSQTILDLVGAMLRKMGYQYDFAHDGAEAITILEQEGANFDYMLLDWHMPIMGGLAVLDAVKQDKLPAGAIIMMTTENTPATIMTSLEKGAAEYIMKPFTEEILRNKLEFAKKPIF